MIKYKLTIKEIQQEALKFSKRTQFKLKSRLAYIQAQKLNILDDVCQHMLGNTKWTVEKLTIEAKKYRTRREFDIENNPAYQAACRLGIINKICNHMYNQNYSIPQQICKQLLDTLLLKNSLYNSRKIIPPYELDLYYPTLKLAIEYNGYWWHNNQNAKRRDYNKNKLCIANDIQLITLFQHSRNYEIDIKNQIINHLDLLNQLNNSNITISDINRTIINYDDIYKNIGSKVTIEEIQNLINKCKSLKEFIVNHRKEYEFLRKTKQLSLLNSIKSYKTMTNEEVLYECLKYTTYGDFQKSRLYGQARRKNILREATKHMTKLRKYETTTIACTQ